MFIHFLNIHSQRICIASVFSQSDAQGIGFIGKGTLGHISSHQTLAIMLSSRLVGTEAAAAAAAATTTTTMHIKLPPMQCAKPFLPN